MADTCYTHVSVYDPPPDQEMFNSTPTVRGQTVVPELVRSHFQNAFGAPLLLSEGGPCIDVWCKFCLRIVSSSCHYNLPVGLLVVMLLSYFHQKFLCLLGASQIRMGSGLFICYVAA